MLKLLDFFFIAFHSVLILFNLFGWITKRTRRLNLITLLLTGASWFILGIFYGIGYCPLTDWHFRILGKLGERDLPMSYISYLLTRFTGMHFNENLIDSLTLWFFLIALLISFFVNFFYPRLKRRAETRTCK
jgi:hypothetical protein